MRRPCAASASPTTTRTSRTSPDILCLTHPDEITAIHRHYLEAGADIIETNTFGASPVGMEEFELPDRAGRGDQRRGGELRRQACEEFTDSNAADSRGSWPGRSVRPPSRWRSARSVDDPAYREHHVRPDGRVVLRAGRGAGRSGRRYAAARNGHRYARSQGVPVRDREVLRRRPASRAGDGLGHVRQGGRDVRLRPIGRGVLELDLALPAAERRHELRLGPGRDAAALRRLLQQVATTCISCYPNAGLPNEMGQFDLDPAAMARMLGEFAETAG